MVVETAFELRGEGALTDAGRVGLGHADDAIDQGGADTSTDAGSAGNGVG